MKVIYKIIEIVYVILARIGGVIVNTVFALYRILWRSGRYN